MKNCQALQQQYADYARDKFFPRDSWDFELNEKKSFWKTVCVSGLPMRMMPNHVTWKTPPKYTPPPPAPMPRDTSVRVDSGKSAQLSAGRSKSSDPGSRHEPDRKDTRGNMRSFTVRGQSTHGLDQPGAARSQSSNRSDAWKHTLSRTARSQSLDTINRREITPQKAVKLDFTYGISLQAFEPEIRPEVKVRTHVFFQRMTCPYAFVKFNEADDEDDKSIKQEMASPTLNALYNRYLQRKASKQKASSSAVNSTQLAADLKIIGITGSKNIFRVWCMDPKARDLTWAGATLTSVARYDCTSPHDVRKFMDWINEIHRWGLTVHGQSWKDELEN